MQLEAYDFLPENAKRIREAVFMKEQGFKNEFDDIDLLALHLILYDGSQPAATCRLFPAAEQGVYLLGRLAVVKTYRGQKLGQRMLREAEAIAARKGAAELRLHAQCRASRFYTQAGYTPYGAEDDDEGCPHIWMKKTLR